MQTIDELTLLADSAEQRLKEIDQERFDLFETLCLAVLDYPGVDFIGIQGGTPAFNDGDLCTHSVDITVNSLGYDYDVEIHMDIMHPNVPSDTDKWNFIAEMFELEQKQLPSQLTGYSSTLLCILHSLENDYMKARHNRETDYSVVITKNGDKLNFEIDDYDMGY